MDQNKPSPEQVAKYQKKWESSQKNEYGPKEIRLTKLFTDRFPKNVRFTTVLFKAKELNELYKTRISDSHIELMAKHIVELDIDQRLANQDLTLVNDIADNEKTKRNYSFAAKYCSFHFPDDYPIYDSLVAEVLCHFYQEDRYSSYLANDKRMHRIAKACHFYQEDRYSSYFSKDDLKDYPTFHAVLMDFMKFYGLEECSLKEIDHYLWQVGKDLKKEDTESL